MESILHYFPDITIEQRHQFEKLLPLYTYWNERINVISRKDIQHLYCHHVLHSLSIAKLITFETGTSILDVGTGGGFPGIPLAIMFPEARFHLVDSIGKKIKVVEIIVNEMELKNVSFAHARVEDLNSNYDFIISRAVTSLPVFMQWVKNRCRKNSLNVLKNGVIYLKGGDINKEVANVYPQKINIYPISMWFADEFFKEKYILHLPANEKV
ncbi:MAG: 16S rRNA (guanine(527)-N(7))-methyltransferase RsmG [Bacteroidales bacterium]|jgi:16S rRNA (guanine527-N7)-methyltransferase|nr:16S rRNA (guanine(527)-N(7))-methyltransferase RsmG [Bacteroidales bacterium]